MIEVLEEEEQMRTTKDPEGVGSCEPYTDQSILASQGCLVEFFFGGGGGGEGVKRSG